MNKLYIPLTQTHLAKVIPLNASPIDEWISLEDAARLFQSTKHPKGIQPKSFLNKVWKKPNEGGLPFGSFTWSPTGWWFHKPSLMGLRSLSNFTNNAA